MFIICYACVLWLFNLLPILKFTPSAYQPNALTFVFLLLVLIIVMYYILLFYSSKCATFRNWLSSFPSIWFYLSFVPLVWFFVLSSYIVLLVLFYFSKCATFHNWFLPCSACFHLNFFILQLFIIHIFIWYMKLSTLF